MHQNKLLTRSLAFHHILVFLIPTKRVTCAACPCTKTAAYSRSHTWGFQHPHTLTFFQRVPKRMESPVGKLKKYGLLNLTPSDKRS